MWLIYVRIQIYENVGQSLKKHIYATNIKSYLQPVCRWLDRRWIWLEAECDRGNIFRWRTRYFTSKSTKSNNKLYENNRKNNLNKTFSIKEKTYLWHRHLRNAKLSCQGQRHCISILDHPTWGRKEDNQQDCWLLLLEVPVRHWNFIVLWICMWLPPHI